MTLPVGSTLASYKILGPLGAGAMGEVYRARDTKLEREVAIKVLPEHFASDEERLKRFEREARTLASLNHPNVAQIFGVDQVGDTCFLVLELVPGETLEERLKRGPLPVDEAVDCCRQIAEGLETAHDAGVIHRDLKPANVRITPEGKVKILDFGLAKPVRDAAHPSSSTDSVLSTESGRLLGTPTYMAPEQARGKPIDKRVDLWALGCVLYECLTARRAFTGDTLTDILGAVLHAEPDLARLPSDTPARVRVLLADCFVKDPRARIRDAGEIRRQLDRAREVPAEAGPGKRMRLGAAVSLAVLAAVASSLAAVFAGRIFRSDGGASAARTPTRFTVTLPDPITKPGEGITGIALSPDGRSLAISTSTGRGGIHVRELARIESRLLPGTESPADLCFSPDGRSIAYFDTELRTLRRVTLDGGKSQLIRPQLWLTGMTWTPEGRIVVNSPGGDFTVGLVELDPTDGSSTPLTKIDAERGDGAHASPCFLPGSRGLIYTVWSITDSAEGHIDFVDLGAHVQRTVQRDGTTPEYLPLSDREGALLFVRGESLWARRFDPRAGECRGDEVLLAEGLHVPVDVGEAFLAVSPDGTIAYQAKVANVGVSQLWWVSRDGKEELATPEKMHHASPTLSADGKLLAFTRGDALSRVYAVDLRPPLAERTARRLTLEGSVATGCAISPDGARLAYIAFEIGTPRAYVQELAGGNPPRVLFDGDAVPISWSRDGLWVAVIGSGATGGEVKIASADGSSPPRSFVQVKGNAYDPRFSPDGRWLAYAADEDGVVEVYVVDFPGGTRRVQVTNGGGGSPRWKDDGTELYYRGNGAYVAVPVKADAEISFGAPQVMFQDAYDASWFSVGFCPAPDGRFLMNKPLLPEDRELRVVVVENFDEEVRAKLATTVAR